MRYDYVIVGGGMAAAHAIEGIRSRDPAGSILLATRENYAPYRRGPLSKELWFGTATLDDLAVHADAYYREQRVQLALRREIVEIDPETRRLWDDHGESMEYGKLLLATGARPRFLGATDEAVAGVRYFRTLEDYLVLRSDLRRLQHALVFGGGYVALELAPALRSAGMEVTLLHPYHQPLAHAIPSDLARHVTQQHHDLGIETVSDDLLVSFAEERGVIVARTRHGNTVSTQLVVADAGNVPNTELAESAGIEVGNGIAVDEYGCTTSPNVFAAGDVAEVPVLALEKRMRIECDEHARLHGRLVGVNMAGGNDPYDELPAFRAQYPGLEIAAVGEIATSMSVAEVWETPFQKGAVFYVEEDRLRGALLWNTVDQLDWARRRIRDRTPVSREEFEGQVAGR